MAEVVLFPGKLSGDIDFIKSAPSKSILHREIICSALAGSSDIPYFDSDDIRATHDCMKHILTDTEPCFVGESGSTLRFLIPLSVMLGGRTFITQGRLSRRPLFEYQCMKDAGIEVSGNRITTFGSLKSGIFYMRGDISSQFVTGLMLTLPMLSGDSRIEFTRNVESTAYIDLTVQTLMRYGIKIFEYENGFFIPGQQKYTVCKRSTIEGDWSYAAFFVVANALGCSMNLYGLNEKSLQADAIITELLDKTDIDVSQCPDLFPILCVHACGKVGVTRIHHAQRVRLKESDRLNAMAQELKKLGADIHEEQSAITIYGQGKLKGGEVWSHNDHRVAMALGIAAKCVCTDKVTVKDADCVKKSSKGFWEVLGID